MKCLGLDTVWGLLGKLVIGSSLWFSLNNSKKNKMENKLSFFWRFFNFFFNSNMSELAKV